MTADGVQVTLTAEDRASGPLTQAARTIDRTAAELAAARLRRRGYAATVNADAEVVVHGLDALALVDHLDDLQQRVVDLGQRIANAPH